MKRVFAISIIAFVFGCKQSGSEQTLDENKALFRVIYPNNIEVMSDSVHFEWSSEGDIHTEGLKLILINNSDTIKKSIASKHILVKNLENAQYTWYIIDTLTGFKSDKLSFYVNKELKKLRKEISIDSVINQTFEVNLSEIGIKIDTISLLDSLDNKIHTVYSEVIKKGTTDYLKVNSSDSIVFPLFLALVSDTFKLVKKIKTEVTTNFDSLVVDSIATDTIKLDSLALDTVKEITKLNKPKQLCLDKSVTFKEGFFNFSLNCEEIDTLLVTLKDSIFILPFSKEFKLPYINRDVVNIKVEHIEDSITHPLFTYKYDVKHYYEIIKLIYYQKKAINTLFKSLGLNKTYKKLKEEHVSILQFDTEQLIKKLDLSNLNLTSLPALDTVLYVGLKIIDLSNNYLSSLPVSWRDIALDSLDLSMNAFEKIKAFNKDIHYVNIASNSLKTIEVTHKIHHLDMSDNSLEKIPYVFVEPLISNLNISNNSVTINSASLNKLISKKESLDVSGNHFIEKLNMHTKSSIKKLILSNMQIKSDLVIDFKNFNKLQYLDISNNKITGRVKEDIKQLKQLQHLNLSKNKISGGINSILDLGALKYLDVSKNNFDEGVNKHSKSALTYVDLSDNRFSGNIEWIQPLVKLKKVDLSNNTFNESLPKLDKMPIVHLNLSNNNFEGSVEFMPENVLLLDLSNNPRLKGNLKSNICNKKNIKIHISNTSIFPCQ